MFFGTNSKISSLNHATIGTPYENLEIVQKFKFLGIMLHSRLKFSEHANYLSSKIYPKLKMLNRIRCYIGTGTALYLYNSLLAPLFSFNDYIYDDMQKADKDKIQVIQNTCLWTCLSCNKRIARLELYTASRVLPLQEQREISTCCIVYNGLNQLSTPFINELFSEVA